MSVLEIPISGSIGERNAAGGVTSAEVRDLLQRRRDAHEIVLRINSHGGYVAEARRIYNAVRAHGARVTARVVDEASSAAIIILLAADYREAAPGARFVLHGVSQDIEDHDPRPWTADRHHATAVAMKALNADLAAFYARHLAMSKFQIEARLRADWRLTADRALQIGLVHHVLR